jgi:hypothetical protein
MRKKTASWLVVGLGALAFAGCSSAGQDAGGAGSESTEARQADHRSLGTGSSPGNAFAFFVATTQGSEYVVSALNGGTFVCGKAQNATSCVVSSIDLSLLDLAPNDATAILREVGRDASAPAVLFAGSISAGALAVQEVWKAPSAARLTGTLIHVSHQPAQALAVDTWTPATVGALDFSDVRGATYCQVGDAGTTCAPSLVPVETDVVSPAGVLLVGEEERGGGFRVTQYFLEISVGYDQDGDGYSYCHDGEFICSGGACSVSENCLHWGGRGLKTVYVRSTDPTFDTWLVATGQLQSGDLAAAP